MSNALKELTSIDGIKLCCTFTLIHNWRPCHHVTDRIPSLKLRVRPWKIGQIPISGNFHLPTIGIFRGYVSFSGGITSKRWQQQNSEVCNEGLEHTDAGRSTTACLRYTVGNTDKNGGSWQPKLTALRKWLHSRIAFLNVMWHLHVVTPNVRHLREFEEFFHVFIFISLWFLPLEA